MRASYPLALVCETLGCSRSSFYYAPKRCDEAELMQAIEGIVQEWPTYGYRRVTAQLARSGRTVNRKKVLRLMRQMGLTVSWMVRSGATPHMPMTTW